MAFAREFARDAAAKVDRAEAFARDAAAKVSEARADVREAQARRDAALAKPEMSKSDIDSLEKALARECANLVAAQASLAATQADLAAARKVHATALEALLPLNSRAPAAGAGEARFGSAPRASSCPANSLGPLRGSFCSPPLLLAPYRLICAARSRSEVPLCAWVGNPPSAC